MGAGFKVEEKTTYIQNRLKENERCKKSGEIVKTFADKSDLEFRPLI